jgi:PAP2 superfamily
MSSRNHRQSLRGLLFVLVIVFSSLSFALRLENARAYQSTSVAAKDLDAAFAVEWMQTLYGRIEADAVSAPVGARLYAYAGVTLYEAVVPGIPGNSSLSGQLTGMPDMPAVEENAVYDWPIVANAALSTTLSGLFPANASPTQQAFAALRDKQISARRSVVSADVLERSVKHGDAVGKAILAWSETDNYKQTRGQSYTLPTGDDSYWVPTTPGTKAVEPYWGSIRTFALPDSDFCAVPLNMEFSADPSSTFYAQAMEVKSLRDNLTDEQKAIAQFWVDTPGITGTPAGHWVSIENQMVDALKLKLDRAAEMYALVGVALGDSFISCWELKYKVVLLRPETYIKKYIRRSWAPYIQTPAFPEYPSGHSVASGAAAEVLTGIFGIVAFADHTGKLHNFPDRAFTSFQAAANEAAISRLYGGIHYRTAIENGLRQGQCIGQRVLKNVLLKPLPQGSGG